jgi:chitodextrinase
MATLVDLGKLRFYFAGEWSSSTEYETNDIVKYGGNIYVYTYSLKASGQLPTNNVYWALMIEGFKFEGVYSNSTAYQVGDGVTHGGRVYVCILDTTGNTPPNSTYWSQFADGIQYEGVYVNSTAYQKNDVVTYGGLVYIAKIDTTGNDPSSATHWDKFVDGISPSGVYNASTAYVLNDVVAYGGGLYSAKGNTQGNLPTSATHWAVFQMGINPRGTWATSTAYAPNDVVTHGGSTYKCLVAHASTVFATNLASSYWEKFNGGVRWRGNWASGSAYLVDDIVKSGVSSYIVLADHTSSTVAADLAASKIELFAEGGDYVLPNTSGEQDKVLGTSGVSGNYSYVSPIHPAGVISATSAVTATSGNLYAVSTASAVFTLTLPASPVQGDFIRILDIGGNCSVNNLTVARNGQSIAGEAADFAVDVSRASIALVYINSYGWGVL